MPGGGLLRLFNVSYGGQASWLVPLSLMMVSVGLWVTRRRPCADLLRAGFVLWCGWLVLTGMVFSLMQGIIHEYSTVALALAIGALVGGGSTAPGEIAAWVAASYTAITVGGTVVYDLSVR